jgi:DNA-binding transcriptional MerR regulator
MQMQAILNDTLSIREMCDQFDVTPRTLRFYESKELLSPVRVGTRRLFTRRDQVRMKLILRGKRFGFSLEVIRQILDVYDRTGDERAQIELARRLAHERLAEMEAEQLDLETRIAELRAQCEAAAQMLDTSDEAQVA